MDTKALLQLADDLETRVPMERFTMCAWHTDSRCGFVGCAIGYFCHFNPGDDLKLVRRDWVLWVPMFGETSCIDAVAARFGISLRAALFLFSDSSLDWLIKCATGWAKHNVRSKSMLRFLEHPHTTAARIRKFVACKLAWDARDMTPGIVHRAANLAKPRVESVVVAG